AWSFAERGPLSPRDPSPCATVAESSSAALPKFLRLGPPAGRRNPVIPMGWQWRRRRKIRHRGRKAASIFVKSPYKFSVSRNPGKTAAVKLLGKAIADAQFSQQDAGTGRINLDLLAQIAYDDAQIVSILEVGAAPDLFHDLLAGHDLPGM